MVCFLKNNEPVFKDIRTKLPTFFKNLRTIQKKTNKYVHKQGFSSFYTTQSYSWSDHRENKIYSKIISDFEETVKAAIGAVAMYRLAIDPLPIILMDEELMMRSADFILKSLLLNTSAIRILNYTNKRIYIKTTKRVFWLMRNKMSQFIISFIIKSLIEINSRI